MKKIKIFIFATLIAVFTSCSVMPKSVKDYKDGMGYTSEKTMTFKSVKRAERFVKRYSGDRIGRTVVIPIEVYHDLPDRIQNKIYRRIARSKVTVND